MNSPHQPDRHGPPPLTTAKNPHKPGPGDVFSTTGTGPGAHGIEGLSEPHKFGSVAATGRNAGSHVAQTKGSPSKDNSSHTKAGVAGSETKDTVRRIK